MKHTARLTALSFLFFVLPVILGLPAADRRADSVWAAPASGAIVLVARDIIDLKWEPNAYPGSTLRFVRWELYRGTTADNLSKIKSSTSSASDHFRDSGLTSGVTYTYRLDVVRCVDPCGVDDQYTYTYFSDSATAGVFQGTLHYSLLLDSGTYNIGFGGVTSSAAVTVVDGAALQVGQGTTLQIDPSLSGKAGLSAHDGRLEITGATLKNVSIGFGDYYEETSAGKGWVKDCLMAEGEVTVSIALYGRSEAEIEHNSGPFTITADQKATLKARNNTMTGGMDVKSEATAVIENNEIRNGSITVTGYGAQGEPKAQAVIANNTLNLDYENAGIRVYYGATATVTDNTINYLGPVDDESSVVLDASDAGTILTAERNAINNGKIAAFWGSQINLADNVIKGEGSALTIGCVVCGTGVQATGTIEGNTISNGWGMEMWAGSQELLIRHNCIQGNDPGLTVEASIAVPLNAENNWWGHPGGPSHESNPGGYGDVIVGDKVDFDPWDKTDANCHTAPPPPEKPDLTVDSVSMVQVVEGVKPLVEAKPTAIKAVVSSSTLINQDVRVQLIYAGKTFHSPYVVEASNLDQYLRLKSPSDVLRFDKVKKHTLMFFPEEVPFGSQAVARVEIDPANEIDEHNEQNNAGKAEQPIIKTYWGTDPNDQALRILFLYGRKDYGGSFKRRWAFWMRGEVLVYHMPLAPIDYLADLGLDKDLDRKCPLADESLAELAKDKHRALKLAHPNFRLFALMTREDWWYYCKFNLEREEGLRYWMPLQVPELVYVDRYNNKILMRAVMHRLGAPTSPKMISVYDGWRVVEKRWVDADFWSQNYKGRQILSVLGYFYIWNQGWVDANSYEKFLEDRRAPSSGQSQAAAAEGLVLVSGTIIYNGQSTLDPIFELPAGVPSSQAGGPYSIALYDAQGQLLSSYDFDVDFFELGEDGAPETKTTAFSFALPRQPATAAIKLKKDGMTLTTLAVSAKAPTVQVTTPSGGETISGSHIIRWNGSDADGDDLFYTVLYSANNGASWTTLAADLSDTSLAWNTDEGPGTDGQGLIKVLASDGYHTATGLSAGTFSVANKAPEAGIIAPIDEAVITQGNSTLLEGAAFDPEQGWLEGDAFAWSSSKDGHLGNGRTITVNLSPGQHLIRLVATDAGGLQSTAEISVTVGSETRPDLALTAADLSYPPLAVAADGWIAAEVRNVVADVSALASFYDGNPGSGGRLLGQVDFFAAANSSVEIGIDWVPHIAGRHKIYAVISDADPAEANTANNQAQITVEVAEPYTSYFLPMVTSPQ